MGVRGNGLRELLERVVGRDLEDDTRGLVEEALGRWRGDASRLGDRAGETLHDVFVRLGLVTREEFEELELRLAQLEHRLRLLETPPPAQD
jgi:BMFP domain-containing protein YqiC